jgi:hypothetical protein
MPARRALATASARPETRSLAKIAEAWLVTVVGSMSVHRAIPAVSVAAAGPLAIACLRGILPYDTVDDTATAVATLQAAPGATTAGLRTAGLRLTLLALLTLPLGPLMAGVPAARTRPVLGTVPAVTAWLGFVILFGAMGVEQVAPVGDGRAARSRATSMVVIAVL